MASIQTGLTQEKGSVNVQVEKLFQTNTNAEVRQYVEQLLVNAARALHITSAEMGLIQNIEMVQQLGKFKTMQANMCAQKMPRAANRTRCI